MYFVLHHLLFQVFASIATFLSMNLKEVEIALGYTNQKLFL